MRQAHRITLQFSTENDAFEEHEHGEIARILRTAAREFAGGGPLLAGTWRLRDDNGNTVGQLTVEKLV